MPEDALYGHTPNFIYQQYAWHFVVPSNASSSGVSTVQHGYGQTRTNHLGQDSGPNGGFSRCGPADDMQKQELGEQNPFGDKPDPEVPKADAAFARAKATWEPKPVTGDAKAAHLCGKALGKLYYAAVSVPVVYQAYQIYIGAPFNTTVATFAIASVVAATPLWRPYYLKLVNFYRKLDQSSRMTKLEEEGEIKRETFEREGGHVDGVGKATFYFTLPGDPTTVVDGHLRLDETAILDRWYAKNADKFNEPGRVPVNRSDCWLTLNGKKLKEGVPLIDHGCKGGESFQIKFRGRAGAPVIVEGVDCTRAPELVKPDLIELRCQFVHHIVTGIQMIEANMLPPATVAAISADLPSMQVRANSISAALSELGMETQAENRDAMQAMIAVQHRIPQPQMGPAAPAGPPGEAMDADSDDDDAASVMSYQSNGVPQAAAASGGAGGSGLPQAFDLAAACSDPTIDPRVAELGPQLVTDSRFRTWMRRLPVFRNFNVTDANRGDFMGLRRIDPTLSGLTEDRHHQVIIKIFEHFCLGRKMEKVIRKNNDNTYVRIVTARLNSKPCSNANISVLNIIYGRAQGGKSEEAVWDCWAKSFVHGCLPIYYVRNSGGLADAPQVVGDFRDQAKRILKYCAHLRHTYPEFSWLTEDEARRFVLEPRLGAGAAKTGKQAGGKTGAVPIGLEVELKRTEAIHAGWVTEDEYALRLTKPQVLVSLLNPSHMTGFMRNALVYKEGATFRLRNGITMSNTECKKAASVMTPFMLMGGKYMRKDFDERKDQWHTIKKAGSGPMLGKIRIHSGYPCCAWNMQAPYDNTGRNAQRLRVARALDEIDQSRSDKENNVLNTLQDNDTRPDVGTIDKIGEALAPEATWVMQDKKFRKRAAEGNLTRVRRKQRRLDAEAERLADGELDAGPGDADAQADARAERQEERALRRASQQNNARHDGGAAAGPDRRRRARDESSDDESDSYDEESEGEESDFDSGASDDESGSNSDASGDDGDTVSVSSRQRREEEEAERQRARTQRLADAVRENEEERARVQEERERLEDEWRQALEEEQESMQEGIAHIAGLQSAAMYNIGITATFFGCLHPTRAPEGMSLDTRITSMEVPDGYNDLALFDEIRGGWYMLVDPTKPAQRGSIRIHQCKPRNIGQPQLTKKRNLWMDKYIIEHKLCTCDANGEPILALWPDGNMYPEEPHAPLKARTQSGHMSYRINDDWIEKWDEDGNERDEWTEHDETGRGMQGWVPYLVEMFDDFKRDKWVSGRRDQNTWARNEELFTTTLEHLQAQRNPLRAIRRVAQGLVISYETREVKQKWKLIADLYSRLGKATVAGRPEPMHEVSLYNFSYEGTELVVNPHTFSEIWLKEALDDPARFRVDLFNYLKTDPRLNEEMLTTEWLDTHYIVPIQELAAAANRKPVPQAGGSNDDQHAPLDTRYERLEAKNPMTGEIVGDPCEVFRLNFPDCKQPRYMATLFTLLDARRFAETDGRALPLPIIGFTKTIGGRAQRYMCHGHRSRVQVMCHTTDIFPFKQLGLCMADAVQEAFRGAGFDDVNNNMTGWVAQEYITTQEFTPLLRNGLLAQAEWVALLANEKRPGEQAEDCMQRVMTDYIKSCYAAMKQFVDDGNDIADITHVNMPATDYPHITNWVIAHVNRCAGHKKFLRHSTCDASERGARSNIREMVSEIFDEQFNGDVEEIMNRQDFLDKLTDRAGVRLPADEYEAQLAMNRNMAHQEMIDSIPIPVFSVHHAPGGTLDQRDDAEAQWDEERIEQIVADYVETRQVTQGIVGAHRLTRQEQKQKKLDKAQETERFKAEMFNEDPKWPVMNEAEGTEDVPERWQDYSSKDVTKWKKARAKEIASTRRVTLNIRERLQKDTQPFTKAEDIYHIFPEFRTSFEKFLTECKQRRVDKHKLGAYRNLERQDQDDIDLHVKDMRVRVQRAICAVMSSQAVDARGDDRQMAAIEAALERDNFFDNVDDYISMPWTELKEKHLRRWYQSPDGGHTNAVTDPKGALIHYRNIMRVGEGDAEASDMDEADDDK